MSNGHDFNFDGGEILSRIGAAWFVSYAYHIYVDAKHNAWANSEFSKSSIDSRTSKYNKSIEFHAGWLHEIMRMKQLDSHTNKCGLKSDQIIKMAREILQKRSRGNIDKNRINQ